MSHISLRRRALLYALLVTGFSACNDSTGSLQPTGLSEDQGAVAEGTAGTVLLTPPTFTVKDQNGNALGGVSVTIAVTAGGGTLTEAPTQSKSGPTPVGVWRLGNIAAVNTITAAAFHRLRLLPATGHASMSALDEIARPRVRLRRKIRPIRAYSARSATSGSTAVARRAGT